MIASTLALIAVTSIAPCVHASDASTVTTTQEYVLGRDLYLSLTPANMPDALTHLRRAVEIDPKNLRAWYSLSNAYRTGLLMDRSQQEAWTQESARIDAFLLGLSADRRRAAGYEFDVLENFATRLKGRIAIDSGEWAKAEAVLRRPDVLKSESELNKGLDISYGNLLYSVGRTRDAATILTRARVADSLAANVHCHLARVHSSLRAYDDAFAVLDQGSDLFASTDHGHVGRWHPLLRRTALFTALATGDKELIAAKAQLVRVGDLGAGDLDKRFAARLDHGPALRKELHASWSEPANRYGYRAESIAIWAAFAGDHDLAFAAVRALPNELASWAIWHPTFDPARSQTGFREAVQRIGLLEYWRSSGRWGDRCQPGGVDGFECR